MNASEFEVTELMEKYMRQGHTMKQDVLEITAKEQSVVQEDQHFDQVVSWPRREQLVLEVEKNVELGYRPTPPAVSRGDAAQVADIKVSLLLRRQEKLHRQVRFEISQLHQVLGTGKMSSGFSQVFAVFCDDKTTLWKCWSRSWSHHGG